jgi:hypothetical protein
MSQKTALTKTTNNDSFALVFVFLLVLSKKDNKTSSGDFAVRTIVEQQELTHTSLIERFWGLDTILN